MKCEFYAHLNDRKKETAPHTICAWYKRLCAVPYYCLEIYVLVPSGTSVCIKKMVRLTVLLVGDNGREVNIFHTLKNILLDKGIGLLHISYKVLNLHAL